MKNQICKSIENDSFKEINFILINIDGTQFYDKN